MRFVDKVAPGQRPSAKTINDLIENQKGKVVVGGGLTSGTVGGNTVIAPAGKPKPALMGEEISVITDIDLDLANLRIVVKKRKCVIVSVEAETEEYILLQSCPA
jgi:3-deoxy-D-manno-octulosonic-acid transferase